MAAPYSSLLIDYDNWDLCVDATGNIAVAAPPYAVAQDVSCAIRTFLGDCYYDQTIGTPYLTTILGQTPPLSYFKQQIESAALTVPSVAQALCVIESIVNRAAVGYVNFTDNNGVTQQVVL
jgi:hypothetical protein